MNFLNDPSINVKWLNIRFLSAVVSYKERYLQMNMLCDCCNKQRASKSDKSNIINTFDNKFLYFVYVLFFFFVLQSLNENPVIYLQKISY